MALTYIMVPFKNTSKARILYTFYEFGCYIKHDFLLSVTDSLWFFGNVGVGSEGADSR